MTHAPKVFLSYSSKDCSEVDKLDLELRRRGVMLWRDRESLPSGRPQKPEIAAAADRAAGFAFYLTMNAARSEWVREIELYYARQNQERDPGLGIVPIFRDDIGCVDEEMVKLGSGGDASKYSLRGLAGYVFQQDEPVQEELRRAAQHVLRSLAASVASRKPKDATPVIGFATRGASAELVERVDFLVDWTEDFKDSSPGPSACTSILRPALDNLWYQLLKRFPSMRFRLVPRCHVSMALMAGFRFRRNTGATIEVGSTNSEDLWPGPREPLEPDMDAWSWRVSERDPAGKHLGVAIAVSMTSEQVRKDVDKTLYHLGLNLTALLEAEPSWGGSKTALSRLDPERPHRMAVALASMIQEAQSKVPGNHIHVFYAGPVTFAVLLGQQLSNLGAIQLYELNRAEGRYEATFELVHE